MRNLLRDGTAKIILALCVTLMVGWSHAQVVLQGRIVDKSGEPIPFASIGIANSHVGTISELNGSFELKIPQEFSDKLVMVSCVGYLKESIQIKGNAGQAIKIIMQEAVTSLDAVVVIDEKIKPKIKVEGKIHSVYGRFMTDSLFSGAAMVQLIQSPFDTTFIHWARLGYFNKIEDLKLRVKFREVDDRGFPGDLLIEKEIIVDLFEMDGFHKMKFEGDQIFLTEREFFIEFEPLILQKNRKEVYHTIASVMEETPHLIRYTDSGELIINNPDVDIKFFQFKISAQSKNTTLYRVSSFGKWYPSEELSVRVGLSDLGTSEDGEPTQELSETKIWTDLYQGDSVQAQRAIRGKTALADGVKTTLHNYENDGSILYTSLSDHLRKIGGIRVVGSLESLQVFVGWVFHEPIFVIDGVNLGRGYTVTQDVDISQIKSIKVLRRVSDTAAYGTEGVYGVVLITTKHESRKKTVRG